MHPALLQYLQPASLTHQLACLSVPNLFLLLALPISHRFPLHLRIGDSNTNLKEWRKWPWAIFATPVATPLATRLATPVATPLATPVATPLAAF